MPRQGHNEATERRHATVMFADISGFTALCEKLDPEEVTAVMNGCFERLESIVFAHGGVVDEYLGDCIKAAFGFSPATASPTVHAVRAALEIRAALEQFNRDAALPTPLAVHIGLNTGPVIATTIGAAGTANFSVMGDTVAFASRLEDVSDKGQIFVGPVTHEESRDEFEYRALEPLFVDSRPAAVPIYELLGLKRTGRVKRQSERRQATVLFADLIGLQALSHYLDDEALSRVMRACFAQLAEVVGASGGVVDKYLGEGVMALFGVPNAIEHAPRRAVNAAIEIRNRVAAFNAEQQLPAALDVHLGVNTGLLIAGEIGGRTKRDFTVMGDTVNLAARLKEAAAHGAIYVGPETHRYTRGDFEYRPLEPLRLKGKEQPVPAYELVSVSKQVHRDAAGRAERMVFSEMVGRDAELATFGAMIAGLERGTGGIVNLVGEAGLGKSRLLSEGLKLPAHSQVRVCLGRSLSIARGQSFHPFIDLLRDWAGIGEEAGEEQTLAALRGAVQAVLGEQTDEVFPFITRLMGLQVSGAAAQRLADIEGEALEKLILKSTRELFHAIAQRRPTALVFEDLHWADQSSLNLLELLLPLCTETPLLFVHVCRPLFEDTSDRIVRLCSERFAARTAEIRLEKLDEAESARLIRNLLNFDDLPAATRTLIAAKAEGNPFYIEEVVRSLIDEGAVEYHDGRFRVTEKIHRVVIPGTIHDVIMARVDRLDESSRQLLQTASVIGRHFYYQIIAHLMERERAFDRDLEVLKEKQLIQESGSRWEVAVGERSIAQELEYMFKHALAQEAVYESVLLKTRKQLHLRVAEAIESLFAERLPEFYATLAYHYTRSEQLEPAERYLCKAGEEAARSAASSEALQQFSEAARIYDTLHGPDGGAPQHRAFLQRHIGLALLNTGKLPQSIEHFDAALLHLGHPTIKSPLAAYAGVALNLASLLTQLYVRQGRRLTVDDWEHERQVSEIIFNRARAEITSDPRRLFFESIAALRRFNQIDATQIDQASAIYASAAGMFCYSGLSFAVGKRILARAKALMRQDNVKDAFTCAAMEFVQHYLGGDWNDAHVVPADLVTEALRHGQLWDLNTYIGLYCDRRLRQGDFAGAQTLLDQLTDLNQTYGYSFAGTNHDGMSALFLLERRQLPEALAAVDAYYRALTEDPLKVLGLGTRAKIQVLMGDAPGAAATLARVETITKRSRDVPPWHLSAYAAARLRHDVTALENPAAADGGRSSLRRRARRSARYALGIAAKVAIQRVEIYQLAGRLQWLLGQPRRALQTWSRSIEIGARMGTHPELARTYAEAARYLTDAGEPWRLNGLDAAGCAAKARTLFVETGLEAEAPRLVERAA